MLIRLKQTRVIRDYQNRKGKDPPEVQHIYYGIVSDATGHRGKAELASCVMGAIVLGKLLTDCRREVCDQEMTLNCVEAVHTKGNSFGIQDKLQGLMYHI